MKILVAYHSISGSTAEAARILRDRLAEKGHGAELRDIRECADLSGYDAVVIGGPMRFGGYIAPVRKFISKHRESLSRKKVCLFITCLYIISAEEDAMPGFPVYIDPSFKCGAKPLREMDFMDRTHRVAYYLPKLTGIAGEIAPCSIAFFNGRLSLRELGAASRLFMRVITAFTSRERVGDFLNPAAVGEWADDCAGSLNA